MKILEYFDKEEQDNIIFYTVAEGYIVTYKRNDTEVMVRQWHVTKDHYWFVANCSWRETDYKKAIEFIESWNVYQKVKL